MAQKSYSSIPNRRAINAERYKNQRRSDQRDLVALNGQDYNKLAKQLVLLQATLLEERRKNAEKDALISHLQKEAFTDHLTGIFNRKGLLHAFTDLTQKNDGVIVLIDLDKFKPINDRFGHDAGDEALKLVARTLVKNTRHDTDIVARYGGDEFLVVLKDANTKDIAQRIKKLDSSFNALSFNWQHDGSEVAIKISASIGFAPFKAGETIDRAKAEADKQLYRVKKQKGHKR